MLEQYAQVFLPTSTRNYYQVGAYGNIFTFLKCSDKGSHLWHLLSVRDSAGSYGSAESVGDVRLIADLMSGLLSHIVTKTLCDRTNSQYIKVL